jgi:hypothetical protein
LREEQTYKSTDIVWSRSSCSKLYMFSGNNNNKKKPLSKRMVPYTRKDLKNSNADIPIRVNKRKPC